MKENKNIILFDGICNLCIGIVKIIIRKDHARKFSFASLQSSKGQELLQKHNLSSSDFDSFVYIEDDKIHFRSTAALRVIKKLGGLISLLYVFIIIPRFIRDFIYKLIAKVRYGIFGKRDVCMVPDQAIRDRFIE